CSSMPGKIWTTQLDMHRCWSAALKVPVELMTFQMTDGLLPLIGFVRFAVGYSSNVAALGKVSWFALTYWRMAFVSCLTLFAQEVRLADSRADCTAGSNSAVKTPMIVITTKTSIRVNPLGTPARISRRWLVIVDLAVDSHGRWSERTQFAKN